MRVRTIFAGIGLGNFAAPENTDFVLSASSEETFAPAANLRDVMNIGHPWQSADGAAAELTWHYGGSQVRASAFSLTHLDFPEDARITLELWSDATPGSGTKVYSVDRVPAWFAYMSPTSTAVQQWGQWLWGGELPAHVRRSYPRHFLHVVMSEDGTEPQMIPHRSGRYIFEMEDPTDPSPLGYWQAAYLDISQAWMTPRAMDWEWVRGRRHFGNLPIEGPSGVVRPSGGGSKRYTRLTFRAFERDEMLHNLDALQADFGLERPFIVIPDPGKFFEDVDSGTHQPLRPDRWIFEAGLWRLASFFDTRPEQAFRESREDPLWSTGSIDLEEWK